MYKNDGSTRHIVVSCKRQKQECIDSGQPAQSAQADLSRYIFADVLSPLFTEHCTFFFNQLDCHSPRLIVHGLISFTNTTFNSMAKFECNFGYEIDGSNQTSEYITCGSDGHWSDQGMECSPIGNAKPCPRVCPFICVSIFSVTLLSSVSIVLSVTLVPHVYILIQILCVYRKLLHRRGGLVVGASPS